MFVLYGRCAMAFLAGVAPATGMLDVVPLNTNRVTSVLARGPIRHCEPLTAFGGDSAKNARTAESAERSRTKCE